MLRADDDTDEKWQPRSNVAKDIWEIAGFGQFSYPPRNPRPNADKGDNGRGQSNCSDWIHWLQKSVSEYMTVYIFCIIGDVGVHE